MKGIIAKILFFLLWYIPFFISATGDKYFNSPSCVAINWIGMTYPSVAVFLLVVIPAIYVRSFASKRFHLCICALLCQDFITGQAMAAFQSWEDSEGYRAYFWKPFLDSVGLDLKEDSLFKWAFWSNPILQTLLTVVFIIIGVSYVEIAQKTERPDKDKKPSFGQKLRDEWRKHKWGFVIPWSVILLLVAWLGINSVKGLYETVASYAERSELKKQEFHQHLESAESGNVPSMVSVGASYWHGDGTEYNTAEALRWWEKAAQDGSADAMVELGRAYYSGYRTGRDWDKARYWLNAAIETNPDKEKNARIVLNRIDRGLLPNQS